MSNKELTLKDFGGEVLSRDKDGNPVAVYIHNEVQSKPTVMDFEDKIMNLAHIFPNNMDLGREVRKYVWKYIKETDNQNQMELDFSKSEYKQDVTCPACGKEYKGKQGSTCSDDCQKYMIDEFVDDDQATKDRKRWGG
mgnify:CR=1 FL=1